MSDDVPDLARVEQALLRIGALDLFLRREGGLQAKVDERGANFSAGERQLLAFARALYKNSPLLILDEATASIDSDTEARLQAALEAVMAGRTALVIAHRLSTIRAVDRIVVFHRGHVVEAGTHDELLALNGVYARLYRLQFAQEALQQEEAKVEAAVVEAEAKTEPVAPAP
jgi:ATP-binding cassette subfamily B protein